MDVTTYPWSDIVIMGVAWGPLVSIIISILKGWAKLDSKWIQPINFGLGLVGMVVFALLSGQALLAAIAAGLVAILTSSGFHEVFGHTAKDLIVGKSSAP